MLPRFDNNIPIRLVGLRIGKRQYTKSQTLTDFVTTKYNTTGKGVKYNDLIASKMAKHKSQAQVMLKHALKSGILFTLGDHRPQTYYPSSFKSEIIKNQLSKNIPIKVTGVTSSEDHNSIVLESLEKFVLPLLPTSPIFIHKLQLKLKLNPRCYDEIRLANQVRNMAKDYTEIIGNNRVTYLFYPKGTVIVSIENSNNPLKLENEEDRSYILTFLGQVRDRLIFIVSDPHERLVPNVLTWHLTQCDIDKDIIVSDWFQVTALKVQLSHLDHLFRLYIRSMGKDTVCRVEEAVNPNRPCIEAINEIFNPNERTNKLLIELVQKISQLEIVLARLELYHNKECGSYSGGTASYEIHLPSFTA